MVSAFRPAVAAKKSDRFNLRYGTEPGVLFYTHVSDQYAPFHTKVINATVRDATHVLDGLLYHESTYASKNTTPTPPGSPIMYSPFVICWASALRRGSETSPTRGSMFSRKAQRILRLLDLSAAR